MKALISLNDQIIFQNRIYKDLRLLSHQADQLLNLAGIAPQTSNVELPLLTADQAYVFALICIANYFNNSADIKALEKQFMDYQLSQPVDIDDMFSALIEPLPDLGIILTTLQNLELVMQINGRVELVSNIKPGPVQQPVQIPIVESPVDKKPKKRKRLIKKEETDADDDIVSNTTHDEEIQERKDRRKDSNRRAAKNSRDRKIQYVRNLEAENARLKEEVAALRAQLRQTSESESANSPYSSSSSISSNSSTFFNVKKAPQKPDSSAHVMNTVFALY